MRMIHFCPYLWVVPVWLTQWAQHPHFNCLLTLILRKFTRIKVSCKASLAKRTLCSCCGSTWTCPRNNPNRLFDHILLVKTHSVFWVSFFSRILILHGFPTVKLYLHFFFLVRTTAPSGCIQNHIFVAWSPYFSHILWPNTWQEQGKGVYFGLLVSKRLQSIMTERQGGRNMRQMPVHILEDKKQKKQMVTIPSDLLPPSRPIFQRLHSLQSSPFVSGLSIQDLNL